LFYDFFFMKSVYLYALFDLCGGNIKEIKYDLKTF